MTFLKYTETAEAADITGGVLVPWLCSRSYTNQPVEGIIPKGQKVPHLQPDITGMG